jgi:hypothetical protein
MQMNNQDLDSSAIEELNYQIELGAALDRLEQNPDFVKVIKEAVIKKVLLVDSQYMLDVNPHVRQEALEKVQSVNYLRQELTEIKNIAEGAKQDRGAE